MSRLCDFQLSLFFDILLTMCTDVSEEAFVTGERSGFFGSKSRVDTSNSVDIQTARASLWKHLSQNKLKAGMYYPYYYGTSEFKIVGLLHLKLWFEIMIFVLVSDWYVLAPTPMYIGHKNKQPFSINQSRIHVYIVSTLEQLFSDILNLENISSWHVEVPLHLSGYLSKS